MDTLERLFEEIPGSRDILVLLQEQLPDYVFPNGIQVHWLHVRGSLDLVLGARVASPGEIYCGIPQPPQPWPHLIVSASQGQLIGVRSSDHNSSILEATAERAIVLARTYSSDAVCWRDKDRRIFAECESILDFRYTLPREVF